VNAHFSDGGLMGPASQALFSRNVVLDTSFFISKGFNFRHDEIQSLCRLGAEGSIRILVVDITLKELHVNMREAVSTAHAKLGQAEFAVLRSLPLFRRFTDVYGEDRILFHLHRSLEDFISQSKAIILQSDEVVPSRVFDRYFRQLPPFSKDKKKHRKGEFPDAFSLEAVNSWCSKTNERAYLISEDSDWHLFGEVSHHFFDDRPRLFAITGAAELVQLVLRNDAALVDLTRFADSVLKQESTRIEEKVMLDIQRCRFVPFGDDPSFPSVSSGVLSVSIASAELIKVDRHQSVYTVTLSVHVMLRRRDDEYHRWNTPPSPDDKLLSLHTPLTLTVSLDHKDGVPGTATFNFVLPGTINIEIEEATKVSASEFIASRPVVVVGVENGRVTENGNGMQQFANMQAALAVFPDLNVWTGSSRFTDVLGNKLCGELRFESWKAFQILSS